MLPRRHLLSLVLVVSGCNILLSNEPGEPSDPDDASTIRVDANTDDGGRCTKRTCLEAKLECGPGDDGCGGLLNCGDCVKAGDACSAGQCKCAPKTCEELGAECGEQPAGCNDLTLDCKQCPDGLICGGAGPNKCGEDVCTAVSCAGLGKNCGKISDGCGAILECGECKNGEVCGGNGVPNVCACQPKTCAQLGVSCGAVDNGCGTKIECGECAKPETCGGGGTEGVCGCARATCGERTCGQNLSDGCGGTINCGTCEQGKICDSNGQCASTCTPKSKEMACAGKCGTVGNGCNTGSYECGGCETDQSCVNSACLCNEVPQSACNERCGTITNSCGKFRNCTNCIDGYQCNQNNVCVCKPLTKLEACLGKNCGEVDDGCGGKIGCCLDGFDCDNSCGSNFTCENNECTCGEAGRCPRNCCIFDGQKQCSVLVCPVGEP